MKYHDFTVRTDSSREDFPLVNLRVNDDEFSAHDSGDAVMLLLLIGFEGGSGHLNRSSLLTLSDRRWRCDATQKQNRAIASLFIGG
jgi:hypothetical protein